LAELGRKAGVDLVPVEWKEDKALPVPSVVHWKDNHYAAIISTRDGMYEVNDPVVRGGRAISAEDLRREASGYFLMAKSEMNESWRSLNESEAAEVYGRGTVSSAPDSDDSCSAGGSGGGSNSGSGGDNGVKYAAQASEASSSGGASGPSCGTCGGGAGGSGGGTGGNGSSCSGPTCHGMARWEVSEPSINLWVYDEPVGYQPALGPRASFKLSYKQRDVEEYNTAPRTIDPDFVSVGTNWHSSWISYVVDDNYGEFAWLMTPDGGWRYYYPSSGSAEYFSGSRIKRSVNGAKHATFIISYVNGATNYYSFVPSETPDPWSYPVALLTASVDAHNHTNQFIYLETNSMVFLQYMIDGDGRTNTLHYNTSSAFPTEITGVTDPFGHNASLKYDENGVLTNITDEIGMTSSFVYDDQYWMTNLTTPYGTTTFENITNSDNWGGVGNYTPVRALRVVDAAGGTNVYMVRQDCSFVAIDGVTNSGSAFINEDGFSYDNVVPSLPAGVDPTFGCNQYLQYRNSFHWGPMQAAALPHDMYAYTPTDLKKARMRHWLHDNNGGNLGMTMTMEQAPSQDGINRGQITWYDYYECGGVYDTEVDSPGDTTYGAQGSRPSLIAKVLPDSTTQFEWIERDPNGNPTNVVDSYSTGYDVNPEMVTNIFVYDANDINQIQHIGPLGDTEGYAYNANNQVLLFTNALNEITSCTYDNQTRLTSVTTPAGLVTTNFYYTTGSFLNLLQTSIDLQIQRTNSYTYTNDLIYTHTDERGLTTTNNWDALNRLVKVTYPDGTFVTNSYYRLDLVQQIDRMKFPTEYGYDGVRHLIAVTNALGNFTLYNYCPCGALESVQDAAGNDTFFTYDNAGNRLLASYPDGYSVSYTYDLPGRLISSIDSGGVGLTNWYNNQGLKYAVSNAVGLVSLLAFDAENHITNSTDANHVSVSMAYDLLGRVLTRTYPDSGVESYGYTFGISGPSSYTNQIGNVTGYLYDPALRKVAETNALNFVTRFTNSPAGDLLSLTDGNTDTTTWAYDPYGRVTNKVDAAHNLLFVYQYDPDTRLTNRWSAAKGSTTYGYDSVGNLTGVVYPVSPAITLKYDVLNRLTNMVDALGATVYGYDAVGELTAETGPWSSDTVNYTYQNRLRISLSLQTPGGASWTQSYGYDYARRLKTLTSPAGGFGYVYDPAEALRVDKLMLPNGAAITNSFDNVARLTGTWLRSSAGADLDSYVYTYNYASQRTNVVRAAGDYVNYLYDGIGELTNALAQSSSGTRMAERLGYRYDAAGNLNLKWGYPARTAYISGYSLNQLNEITNSTYGTNAGAGWGGAVMVSGSTTSPATSVMVNGIAASIYTDNTFATSISVTAGANTLTAIAQDVYGRSSTNISSVTVIPTNNAYAYDLNGNLLTDGTRGFAYDDENQLISVYITNTWRNDFVYDGKMRRRIERDYNWSGSAWTQTNEIHFVYDGNLVIQERDINNQPQVTYTRGNDLSGRLQGAGGIGGLLARSDRNQVMPGVVTSGGVSEFGTHSYYHADGNGNVTMLIAASQMIVAKYLYDPFGNTLAKCGLLADVNSYRFSSKEWNGNSGLYYYLYRFYDPNLQRWLNRDPISEGGFEICRFRGDLFIWPYRAENLYEFCVNQPANKWDKYGLDACTDQCWGDKAKGLDKTLCAANYSGAAGAAAGGFLGGGKGGLRTGIVWGGVIGATDWGAVFLGGAFYYDAAFLGCMAGCKSTTWF
jgi:RHS repeat-associated protein